MRSDYQKLDFENSRHNFFMVRCPNFNFGQAQRKCAVSWDRHPHGLRWFVGGMTLWGWPFSLRGSGSTVAEWTFPGGQDECFCSAGSSSILYLDSGAQDLSVCDKTALGTSSEGQDTHYLDRNGGEKGSFNFSR